MFRSITQKLRRGRQRFIGEMDVPFYRSLGMVIGEDVWIGPGNRFDPSTAWLITIGDDVVFGPEVHILAHDAALRRRIGFTKMRPVSIGSHCFIGSHTLILPGVHIGDDCIIGAGSLLTQSIPSGSVAYGNPARVVMKTEELVARERDLLDAAPRWNEDTPGRTLTREERARMRAETPADGFVWGS